MITMRALCITAEKCRGIIFCQNNSGYSALVGKYYNSPTSHKSFRFSIAESQIVAIYGIFPNATYIYMKCLSIFKGHEHILGDKIAKFKARALATLHLQRRIYSSICLYQTYRQST